MRKSVLLPYIRQLALVCRLSPFLDNLLVLLGGIIGLTRLGDSVLACRQLVRTDLSRL